GLGFLLLLPLMLRLARFVIPWKPLRTLVLLLFVAVLLTPTKAYNVIVFLAPAWMVSLLDFVRLSSVAVSVRVLTSIVVTFAGLIVVYMAWLLLRHLVFKAQQKTPVHYRNFTDIAPESAAGEEAKSQPHTL